MIGKSIRDAAKNMKTNTRQYIQDSPTERQLK